LDELQPPKIRRAERKKARFRRGRAIGCL